MALSFARKEELVQELHQSLGAASAVIAVDACGMPVSEADELRTSARQAGGYLRIVPNRLALRAIKDTPFECLSEILTGPTMLAWCENDPVPLAALLDKFESDNLTMKGITFGDSMLPPSEVSKVAALPSREEALTQIASLLLAPVSRLATALSGVPRKLAIGLAAVRDQKQSDN